MCQSCEVVIDTLWFRLSKGQVFRTPDFQNSVRYEITDVTSRNIKISPQNITIEKESFQDALHYLKQNGHNYTHPCEIGSDNSEFQASQLCCAARTSNHNVRCINYIASILQNNGLAGIGCNRKNTIWLI